MPKMNKDLPWLGTKIPDAEGKLNLCHATADPMLHNEERSLQQKLSTEKKKKIQCSLKNKQSTDTLIEKEGG